MMHDLKPYPAMKDSSVPRLGRVPECWGVQPALAVMKIRYGQAVTKHEPMFEKTSPLGVKFTDDFMKKGYPNPSSG